LGEHLLCKQGVSGSIPLSSTRTHSLFPDRRHVGWFDIRLTPIWKQARQLAGFSTAQGRAVRENDETVWMFDNEIDWVIAHRA
jgi:hypothetical protein